MNGLAEAGVARAWPRLAGVALAIACGLAVQASAGGQGQALRPELDRARREPILDGRGAGGIQLGDTMAVVTKKMGGLPDKTEEFERGARRDFLYVGMGPDARWGLVLGVVFRQDRVSAVWIVTSRWPSEPSPYEGRTSHGYGIGEPPERLRALYGPPDAVIPDLRIQVFWWYRAAGLLIAPGERVVQDQAESRLIVLDPQATAADVRRVLHLP